MSLSTFLERPDVKARFKQEFERPKLKCSGKIKIARRTDKYSRLGTAFDYLLRFWIETLNPNAEVSGWIADMAPMFIGLLDVTDKEKKRVKQLYKEAKKCHANYLMTGEMDDEIISTAIILAQMDMVWRRHEIDPDVGEKDIQMVDELRDLIKLANKDYFTAKAYCALNPTFGSASVLIDGADADLIIDDTIIDIKTTIEGTITSDYFNQLIGYYVLSELGEVNHKRVQIKRLGIYFSRFGELITFPIEQIVGKGFPQFLEWFRNEADKPFVPTCETCQDIGKIPCPNLEVLHPPLRYNRKNASEDNKCDVCHGLGWITCPDCSGDPNVLYIKNELKKGNTTLTLNDAIRLLWGSGSSPRK